MSEHEKTGYKYRIGFSQSLSTGIIAFEGNVQFDHRERGDNGELFDYQRQLEIMISGAEEVFRDAGYRVASDIAPKVAKEVLK